MMEDFTFKHYRSLFYEHKTLDSLFDSIGKHENTLVRCIEDCTLPALTLPDIDQSHLSRYMAAQDIYPFALKAPFLLGKHTEQIQFTCFTQNNLWYPQILASFGRFMVQAKSILPSLEPNLDGGGVIYVRTPQREIVFKAEYSLHTNPFLSSKPDNEYSSFLWDTFSSLYAVAMRTLRVPVQLYRLSRGLDIAIMRKQDFLEQHHIAGRATTEDTRDFCDRVRKSISA